MLKSQRLALHSLFFLSGAAALAYEVLWMRRFSVLLGATAPAVAAALAAFFAGLGLGSYLLGRLAPRFTRPLLAFAALETATALSALSVEPLLRAMQPLVAWLYDGPAGSAGSLLPLTLRIGIAIAAVLVPATCMGGTLPVLAQFVAARAESLGVRAGGLYAINTLGAACGALAIPAVCPGLRRQRALVAVVTTSLLIAGGALILRGGPKRPAHAAARTVAREGTARARGTLALAFVSGVITLALEAMATRAFALCTRTPYSFATVVAVFLPDSASVRPSRAALRRKVAPAARLSRLGGRWCLDGVAAGAVRAHHGPQSSRAEG